MTNKKEEKNIRRYDRQELIKGWNQEKLSQGAVTIIGSDVLAQYIVLPLTALGVGNIRIIDSAQGKENDLLLDLPLKGKSKAKKLEAVLKKINPEVNLIGIHSNLLSRSAQYFLKNSDVIVDATNSKISKSHTLEYHIQSNIPIISASANQNQGKIILSENPKDEKKYSGIIMPMFHSTKQSDLISLELGGVVAEEVKKVLMKNEDPINIIYNYNLKSSERFNFVSDVELNDSEEPFKDKKILLVGAGALGCFLGPASITNLKPEILDIMDYDTIEDHNLNRQVCFYDAVGQLKAERLAKTLTKMSNGKTQVRAIIDKFTEDSKFDVKYDLILDAVDSFYTKAILHNYAKKHNIPIISGGTDPRAATVLVYAPGKTSCFDCQIGLTQLAIKAEIIRRTSCLQAPDPSVIMTNQIAGGLMVGEARTVLRPDLYGEPINGEIKYISDFESRGGVTKLRKVCNCHAKNKISSLELPDPKRVKIEEQLVDGKVLREIYLDGKKL